MEWFVQSTTEGPDVKCMVHHCKKENKPNTEYVLSQKYFITIVHVHSRPNIHSTFCLQSSYDKHLLKSGSDSILFQKQKKKKLQHWAEAVAKDGGGMKHFFMHALII